MANKLAGSGSQSYNGCSEKEDSSEMVAMSSDVCVADSHRKLSRQRRLSQQHRSLHIHDVAVETSTKLEVCIFSSFITS